MARCKTCGCSSWFFSLSSAGLCTACEHLVEMELRQRVREVRDAAQAADQTISPHSKLARMDIIVQNLSTLAEYEKRGIPAPELDGSAEERLRKSVVARESLIVDTAQAELNEILKRLRGVQDSEEKVKVLSDFLIKLNEYRARLGGSKPLETLTRKVHGTVHRIRLDSLLAVARQAEEQKRLPEARRCYEEAIAYAKSVAAEDPSRAADLSRIEERLRALS